MNRRYLSNRATVRKKRNTKSKRERINKSLKRFWRDWFGYFPPTQYTSTVHIGRE